MYKQFLKIESFYLNDYLFSSFSFLQLQDTFSIQTQIKVTLQTFKIKKENKVTLSPEVTF